jgi:hypothetical protein
LRRPFDIKSVWVKKRISTNNTLLIDMSKFITWLYPNNIIQLF